MSKKRRRKPQKPIEKKEAPALEEKEIAAEEEPATELLTGDAVEEEPATEPLTGDAVEDEPAAEPITEEAVEEEKADQEEPAEEADEAEPAEETEEDDAADKEEAEDGEDDTDDDDAKTMLAEDEDILPALEAANSVVPEKSNRTFGFGIGVGIGIAVLVAVIIGVIMLISNLAGPTTAVDEYIQAYKDGDFEKYFSKDYAVMFKYDNLSESVEQAKQYDTSSSEGLETKVVDTVALSSEVKDSVISQLETAEYKDVDKIQDICIVIMEISRPNETDDSKRDAWVSSFYALKVDGSWYFTTGF